MTKIPSLDKLESTLSEYFSEKAPRMPSDIQKLIVDYGPWLLMIGVLFSLQGVFDRLKYGFFSTSASVIAGPFDQYSMIVMSIASIISLILAGMAVPGLLKKELQGWKWLFYSSLVQTISYALTLELVSLIFFGVIAFYFLFQIRGHYK